ncbi:MAG: response regulator [Candidatus Hydrogenedentes bacterium]|nr:response regulator [Candidatus Hydrogenedentota bacterium]
MNKILIVEDDKQLAHVIAQRLGSDHFECILEHDGKNAFAVAKQEIPDIMILDVMLPRVTGYELCRRIRRDPQLYATPILILTGLGDEPEVVHALEQGADDHIGKPFRFDNLIKKIQALFELRKSLNHVDPCTGLPGMDAVKRQINHRLAREEKVAVCHFDVSHSSAFRTVHGPDQFADVIKIVASSLKETRDGMKLYDLFLGYMGGHHFVAVTTYEQFSTYCNTVSATFKQRVMPLYRPVERQQGYVLYTDMKGREAKAPMMCLSIGVVHNHFRVFHSARHMFEVLTQVKAKAADSLDGGIFVDRRRTDR